MSLALDERQRAMLAEMGIKLWAPSAPRVAGIAPEKEAARAGETSAGAEFDSKPTPTARLQTPAEAPIVRPPVRAIAAPLPTAPAASVPTALGPRPEGVADMDWPQLEATVAACRACGLCAGRTQTVFGVGSRTADWMVIGEAPGENEDCQGQPFVGQAGKLLDNMLAAIGLSRQVGDTMNSVAAGGDSVRADGPKDSKQGVYIANVLKCRPPGNRNPQPDEVAQCDAYLARQVALVRPRIILAMGRFAVQSLLRSSEPVGKLRGRVHRYQGVPLVVTYHPAYLLRNPADKSRSWDDLCLAAQVAEVSPSSPSEAAASPR